MTSKVTFVRSRLLNQSVLSAFALAATGLTSVPAFAQNAAPEGTLEEVLVTVSRVAESIQDVPVAVNVMSGETLRDLRVKDIGDVLAYTPSADFDAGSPDQSGISIRGISSDIYGASGDAAVVAMVDNAVISRSWMRTGAFFDISRVEVARGPQGTTFGRNATGGVVHFLTNRPTDDQEISVGAEFGNYSLIEGTGVWNQPFSDTVSTRLSAYYRERDGYFEQEANGDSLDNQDVKAVRAQVLMSPSDSVDILLRGNYAEDHQDVSSPAEIRFTDIPVIYLSPALISYSALDTDPRRVGATPGQFFDRKLWDVGAELTFNMGDLTLNSLTNFRHGRVDTARDLWGTTTTVVRQESFEDADIIQQELRLDNSAANSRITWVTGLYYLHEDTVRWEQKDIMVGFPVQTYQSFRQENKTDSYGIFANAQFEVTSSTTLSAGARYSYDKKDYTVPFHVCGAQSNRQGDPALGGPSGGRPGSLCSAFMQGYFVPNTIPPNSVYSGLSFVSGGNEASWDDVSYRVSVSQKLGDAWNLYASYATGYKGGGFGNEPNNSLPDSFQPYDPETVATIEVGAKAKLFDNSLRLDVAIFDSDYEDIQAETIAPGTGSAITFNAEGGATIRGAEAQIEWQIGERVTLMSTGSYTDAYYNPPGLIDPTGVVLTAGRFNDLPFWSAFVGGSYLQPLPGGSSLRFYADVRFGGDVQSTLVIPRRNNPQQAALDGSSDNYPQDEVVGANITWTNANGNMSVQLWGRNLTDEDDITTLSSPTALDRTDQFIPGRFQGLLRVGPPLTYGISLNYSWQ
jgi:iron complex outermembrane recepter protein